MAACCLMFFFFSSRRRHTRLVSDWSSDVCSSDLVGHWEKRNSQALENTNPARLAQAGILALVEKYGKPAVVEAVRRGEWLDDNANGTGGVEDLDDYARRRITRNDALRPLFVPRVYF